MGKTTPVKAKRTSRGNVRRTSRESVRTSSGMVRRTLGTVRRTSRGRARRTSRGRARRTSRGRARRTSRGRARRTSRGRVRRTSRGRAKPYANRFIKPKKACVFCKRSAHNVNLGGFKNINAVHVHYYCLLFSLTIQRTGEENQGIVGYISRDIRKELQKSKSRRCCYCNKYGANLGCSQEGCCNKFHLPCGINHNAQQDFNTSTCRCNVHRKPSNVPEHIQQSISSYVCLLCQKNFEPDMQMSEIFWADCCQANVLLHIRCTKDMALHADCSIKCPGCNNESTFITTAQSYGIYIAERDISCEYKDAFAYMLKTRTDICETYGLNLPSTSRSSVNSAIIATKMDNSRMETNTDHEVVIETNIVHEVLGTNAGDEGIEINRDLKGIEDIQTNTHHKSIETNMDFEGLKNEVIETKIDHEVIITTTVNEDVATDVGKEGLETNMGSEGTETKMDSADIETSIDNEDLKSNMDNKHNKTNMDHELIMFEAFAAPMYKRFMDNVVNETSIDDEAIQTNAGNKDVETYMNNGDIQTNTDEDTETNVNNANSKTKIDNEVNETSMDNEKIKQIHSHVTNGSPELCLLTPPVAVVTIDSDDEVWTYEIPPEVIVIDSDGDDDWASKVVVTNVKTITQEESD